MERSVLIYSARARKLLRESVLPSLARLEQPSAQFLDLPLLTSDHGVRVSGGMCRREVAGERDDELLEVLDPFCQLP